MSKQKTTKKNLTKATSISKDKTTKNENEFSLLKTLIIIPNTKIQSDAGKVNITGQLITGILTAFTLIPSALELLLNIIQMIGNIFLTYNNKTVINTIDNSVNSKSFIWCVSILFIEFILCSCVIMISDHLKNHLPKTDD